MKTFRLFTLLLILTIGACFSSRAQCGFAVSLSEYTGSTNWGYGTSLYAQVAQGTGQSPYYNFSWSTGSSGRYQDTVWLGSSSPASVCVTVTDTAGCAVTACYSTSLCHMTDTVTILSSTSTSATLSAVPSGSHGPVTYLWNNTGGITTPTLTVTNNGTYCVNVTDSMGCRTFACKTVSGLCALHITSMRDSSMTPQYAHRLTPVMTGGVAPLTYLWSAGATTAYTDQRYSGSYCVTVTDHASCTASVCYTLNVPCTLSGTMYETFTGARKDLHVQVTGGSHGPVNYTWSVAGVGNTNLYSHVPAPGVYCVTLRDTNCTTTLCDTVLSICNSTVVEMGVVTPAGVSSLNGQVINGTRPYTYAWFIDGALSPTYTDSIYQGHFAQGIYTVCVSVTDSNHCVDSACRLISVQPVGCTLTSSLTDSVFNSYATFQSHSSGARGPVTYSWTIPGATGSTATALLSGTYCVTVTDSSGCSSASCATVHIANCAISANTAAHDYGSYGILSASSTGAHGPSHYHWSDGSTAADLTIRTSGSYCVTVTDSSGCSTVACDTFTFAHVTDTICGTVFNDINGNGILDAGENGLAGRHILLYDAVGLYADFYTTTGGHYTYPVAASTYIVMLRDSSASAFTIPLHMGAGGLDSYVGVVVHGGGHHCGYDFGEVDSMITITGRVYFDANNNGTQDAGESGQAYAYILVGTHYVHTDAAGFFIFTGRLGTYDIDYDPSVYYTPYTITPATGYTVAATLGGTVYAGYDFALSSTTSSCNIGTQIIPHTTVTAGFPAWYHVYVSNYGTNVASGTMTFHYDSVLTFTSATPAQATHSSSTRTLTFNYNGLAPGSYTEFTIDFDASIHVTLGQSTLEWATSTDNCTETTLADNTDTAQQNVTGSWDPNDKLVTPAGKGSLGLIAKDQELKYTIHFQNTGTGPAVNVVLTDLLPATLDPATVHIIGASHPDYALQIDGQQLICRFSQIMLPDSGSDQQGSNGYLSFAVRPIASIAPRTTIQNNANIYFDYNSPVLTSTTLNTIEEPLSVSILTAGVSIIASPNPFSNVTTISVKGIPTANTTLEMYNAIGQQVRLMSHTSEGIFTIHRDKLSAGIYTYQLHQNNQLIGTGKLVIE